MQRLLRNLTKDLKLASFKADLMMKKPRIGSCKAK